MARYFVLFLFAIADLLLAFPALAQKVGDTLKVDQTVSPGYLPSEGQVIPIIVDPAKLIGHNYRVSFRDTTDGLVWDVTDLNTDSVELKSQTNFTGTGVYPVIDGIIVKVVGPSKGGMKSWSIPFGTRRFTPIGGFTGLGLEGFSGACCPNAPPDSAKGTIGAARNFTYGGIATTLTFAQCHTVVLKLAAVDHINLWNPIATPTDPNFSKAYRYLRDVPIGGSAADPSFAPWIINRGSGFVYQDHNYGVPFSAWDIETTPPIRLSVGMFENNMVGGLVDGKYWPPVATGDNSISHEFCFIWAKPYTETADPSLALTAAPGLQDSKTAMMWVMVCDRRADVDWVAGDEFLIQATHPFASGISYSFTAPLPETVRLMLDGVVPKEYELSQNYPNPFNPSTVIRYGLPHKSQISLTVYNTLGQQVTTLVQGEKEVGYHEVRFDASGLSSGVYFYRLQAGTFVQTRKLLSLR